MRKRILFSLAFGFLMAGLSAADEDAFLGSWNCSVYVDQNYPFELTLEKGSSGLGGSVSSYEGSLALERVKFEEGELSFGITHPQYGNVDFAFRMVEKQLEGSLEGSTFQGDITCGSRSQ